MIVFNILFIMIYKYIIIGGLRFNLRVIYTNAKHFSILSRITIVHVALRYFVPGIIDLNVLPL